MAKRTTEYIVLRLDDGGWTEIESVWASSAMVALRSVANQLAEEGHLTERAYFNAIPKTSWKPLPVEAEIQTRLKVG
jgi:hypothetical protein